MHFEGEMQGSSRKKSGSFLRAKQSVQPMVCPFGNALCVDSAHSAVKKRRNDLNAKNAKYYAKNAIERKMKRLIAHLIYRTLGILLVALTVAPVAAQIVVDQCDTMEFSVTSRPSIDETHFVWAIYNSSPTITDVLDPTTALDPAIMFVDGQYAGRKVKVTGLNPGKYYVRIHVVDEISCTDNIEMYVMEVIETIPEIVLEGDSVCIGEPVVVKIIFTGLGPYTIDYGYGDELTGNVVNMNGVIVDGPEYSLPIIDPLPVGPQTFWVIKVEDDCKAYEYPVVDRPRTGILIYPKPTNSKIYVND